MISRHLFLSGLAAGTIFLAGCQPSPDKIYTEANALFEKGNYKEAAPLYEQLLVRDANNVNSYAKLAISYGMLSDWSKCADYARQAIERQADFYDVYEQGANCQLELKKPDAALALYREALKKYPDRLEMKESLGMLEFRQKQLPAAAQTFEELFKINPSNANYAYNVAATYEAMGKYDLAEKYYHHVLKFQPGYANAIFGLGNLAQKRGKTTEAIDAYKQVLGIRPDHLSALLNLAQLQEKTDPKAALKTWKAYLTVAQQAQQDAQFITKAKDHIRHLEGGPAPSQNPSKR